MKKLLLGLGTLASVAAPVAAVIACGSTPEAKPTTVEAGAKADALAPVSAAIVANTDISALFAYGSTPTLDKTELLGTDTAIFTINDGSAAAAGTADEAYDAADATDTIVATVVKVTVKLSTGEVTDVQKSTDGKTFVSDAAAKTALAGDASFTAATDVAKFAIQAANVVIPTNPIATADPSAQAEFAAIDTAITDATTAQGAVTDQGSLDDFNTAITAIQTAIDAYNTAVAGSTPTGTGTITGPGAGTGSQVTATTVAADDAAELAKKVAYDISGVNDLLPDTMPTTLEDINKYLPDADHIPAPKGTATRTYAVQGSGDKLEVVITSSATDESNSVTTIEITGFIERTDLDELVKAKLASGYTADTGVELTTNSYTGPTTVQIAQSPIDEEVPVTVTPNLKTGELDVTYTATLRNEVINGKFSIPNVGKPQATATELADDAVRTSFAKLVSDAKTTKQTTTPASTYSVGDTGDWAKFGLTEVALATDVDVTFKVKTVNDGELVLTATLSGTGVADVTAATALTQDITITGFQTEAAAFHDKAVTAAGAVEALPAGIKGEGNADTTTGFDAYTAAATAYNNAKSAAIAATAQGALDTQVAAMRSALADAKTANAKQTTLNIAAKAAAAKAAVATTAKAAYDAASTTITVDVTIKADDFKNHIGGLVSQAIAKLADFDTIKSEVKTININLHDSVSGKDVTGSGHVGNTAAPHTDTMYNTVINRAINEASEKAAEALNSDHDIAETATGYAASMKARVDAIKNDGTKVDLANAILEAIGNPTRFTAEDAYKPVFLPTVSITDSIKDGLAKLIQPYLTAQAANTDLVDAINAQLDKLA